MTEKDAWITLAGAWANANRHVGCEHHCAPMQGDWIMGVCGTISALLADNFIDMATWQTMRMKLKDYAKVNNIKSGFYWPRDAEGARQRSLFCSKQAEAL